MSREETIQQIYETIGLMKRRMGASLHPSLEKLGISPAQIDLLFAIDSEQPIRPKQLAARLQLTPGAISQLLAALQQSHCITLTTDPADRRVNFVRVSKSGAHKLQVLRQLRHKHFLEAFESLSDAELKQYLRIQQKLLQHFETAPTSPLHNKKESS